MTKVTIDRELLERELLSVLDFSESNLRRVVDHLIDVGYTRAAPRQPEGDNSGNPNLRDGLEVVAWLGGNGFHTEEKEATGAPFPLCHLSDHQRAIADRDATIERLEAGIPRLQEQSHQMRKQLAEQDAEIERLRVKLMTIASAEPGRHNIEWAKAMAATGNNEAYAKWREAFDQRDKLAGLLADVKSDYTHAIHWEDLHATMKRIDDALAEVDK